MKQSLLTILILLVLSACSPAAAPDPTAMPVQDGKVPAAPTLVPALPTPESCPVVGLDQPLLDAGQIQELMLFSHERWQKAWIEAEAVFYAPDGSGAVQTMRYQFWLEHPQQRGRLLEGPAGDYPNRLWVNDGKFTQETGMAPNPIPDFSSSPFVPPAPPTDSISPYPFASYMGTALADLIYSTPLAQRGGFYRVLGRETLAGRQVVVAEWGPVENMFVDRLWVDELTGMILRQQNFGKAGTEILNSDVYITNILFDVEFPSSAFELNQPLPNRFAGDYTDIP